MIFPHVNNTWALGMSGALPPSKRAKLVSDDTLDDASGVLQFEKFSVEKVLFQNPSTKSIGVKGTFTDTEPHTSYAVIVAEKQPLTETSLTELFSGSTKISRSFQNDIYAQYVISPLEGNSTGMKIQDSLLDY